MLIYCVTVVSWHLQYLLKKEVRDWFSLELKPFHTKFCRKATAKLCRQAILWWQGATGPLTCSLSLNGKRWFSVKINKVLMVQRSPRTGPHSGSLTWCLYSSVWPLPPFTWGDTLPKFHVLTHTVNQPTLWKRHYKRHVDILKTLISTVILFMPEFTQCA